MGAEWAVLPLVGLVSNLAIIVFMLRRGVKPSHPSFIWLMLVVLFCSWILSDFAVRLIGKSPSAYPWFTLAYLFADISPTLFVLFALSYTRGFHALERQHWWIVGILVLPKALSVGRSATVVFGRSQPLPGTCPGSFGFCDFQETSRQLLGDEFYFFALGSTLLLYLVGLLVLATPPPNKRTRAYQREIRYIYGGILLLFGLGLSTDIFLPLLFGPVLPGLSSLAIVGMNFVIAVGITRRDVLLFAPVTEQVAEKEGAPAGQDAIAEGRAYVLSRERARANFRRLVNSGFEGLYVGVTAPDPEIVEAFKRTPVIVLEESGWGVREEGNIRYVPCSNLRGLSDSIVNYARTAKKALIYLDVIDPILDLGWITPRAALEIGRELGQSRPGMSGITWLYSVQKEPFDTRELKSLFDFPIVKKAVLAQQFNLILERSNLPPVESARRLATLREIDGFFSHMEIREGRVFLSPELDRHFDPLNIDVPYKMRIFLKQFEGQMTAAGRAEVLRAISALGYSAYSLILRGGDAYLLEETPENRGRGYEILSELVRQGYVGLCITRTEPSKLAERYVFEPGTLVYWLTGERKSDVDLKPAPEYLVMRVKSFVDTSEGKNGVVLLDGLEFLITFSGDQFDAYLKALRRIADFVAQSHTVFMVVYDPEVFPPDRVALIRRSGFEVLPPAL